MNGIHWQKLRQMMVRINKRIRWNVTEKKGLGAMVYLYIPGHPDSDPASGLWETIALPNPLWFPITPMLDTSVKDPKTGKEHWVRGYASFFKALRRFKDPVTRQPIFDKDAVKALNIGAYSTFNSAKFRRDLNERNKSDVEKWNDKYKGIFRANHNNGQPLGWKPKKLITF